MLSSMQPSEEPDNDMQRPHPLHRRAHQRSTYPRSGVTASGVLLHSTSFKAATAQQWPYGHSQGSIEAVRRELGGSEQGYLVLTPLISDGKY